MNILQITEPFRTIWHYYILYIAMLIKDSQFRTHKYLFLDLWPMLKNTCLYFGYILLCVSWLAWFWRQSSSQSQSRDAQSTASPWGCTHSNRHHGHPCLRPPLVGNMQQFNSGFRKCCRFKGQTVLTHIWMFACLAIQMATLQSGLVSESAVRLDNNLFEYTNYSIAYYAPLNQGPKPFAPWSRGSLIVSPLFILSAFQFLPFYVQDYYIVSLLLQC